MVSTSMPENPKALSPSTQTTLLLLSLLFSTAAAAMAKPRPTPIVPKVPASNLHILRVSEEQGKTKVRAVCKLLQRAHLACVEVNSCSA